MNRTFYASLMLSLVFSLLACGGGSDSAKQAARDELMANQPAPAPAPAAPAATTATAPPAGVEHYTCPNGHVGGGGAIEGSCTQCGTALVHNQAFHANDAAATPNPATTATNPLQPQTPEPAQNAKGVWHYTCAKGCSGGGGGPGNCASCGGPLAHNQSYHN